MIECEFKYAVDSVCFVPVSELAVNDLNIDDFNVHSNFAEGVITDKFVNMFFQSMYVVVLYKKEGGGASVKINVEETDLDKVYPAVGLKYKKGNILKKSWDGFKVFVFHKWILDDYFRPIEFVVIDNTGTKHKYPFQFWFMFDEYPITPDTFAELVHTFETLKSNLGKLQKSLRIAWQNLLRGGRVTAENNK